MAELSNLKAEQLVAMYRNAEADIMIKLTQALLKGNNPNYLLGQMQSIKGILSQLQTDGALWTGQVVPLIYQQGLDRADQTLEEAGSEATLSPAFGAVNQQAVQTLTDNANQKLSEMTNFIGRNMDDVYRNLALESIRGAAIGYDTWRQAAKQYKSNLADKGVTGFKDKSGRAWNMNSYVKMVARTTTMECHLDATKNRLLSAGHDLVKVSKHANPCKFCAPWEGKILSLTGKTPGYPTLADAKGAKLFHPNCEHGYTLSIDLEDDIVPEKEEPQGTGDLTPLSGKLTYNAKSKGVIKQLNAKFDPKSKLESRSDTKVKIAKNLADRLKDNPDFDKLIDFVDPSKFGTGGTDTTARREALCAQLLNNWAGASAGDSLGVAMQLNANKLFKLGNSTYTGYGSVIDDAAAEWGKHDKGIQAFLKAQYDNTQEFFRAEGITHVPALRGAGWKRGSGPSGVNFDGETTKQNFQLQPLSSFSTDPKTAESFSYMGGAEHRMLVGGDIPVDRIFSTCQTGFGCKNEYELVVIGGTDDLMAVSYDVKQFLKPGFDVPKGSGLFKAMNDVGKVAK